MWETLSKGMGSSSRVSFNYIPKGKNKGLSNAAVGFEKSMGTWEIKAGKGGICCELRIHNVGGVSFYIS